MKGSNQGADENHAEGKMNVITIYDYLALAAMADGVWRNASNLDCDISRPEAEPWRPDFPAPFRSAPEQLSDAEDYHPILLPVRANYEPPAAEIVGLAGQKGADILRNRRLRGLIQRGVTA